MWNRLSLVLCLIINCIILQIQANCVFHHQQLTGTLFLKDFGRKKIIIKNTPLELDEGDSIEGYCSDGFEITRPTYFGNLNFGTPNHLIWRCIDSRLKSSLDIGVYELDIRCPTGYKLEVFQSDSTLTDCQDTTLVLGNKLDTNKNDIKSAALCFDPEKQKLGFLSFIAHAKTNVLQSESLEPNELDYVGLDSKIIGFHELFAFLKPNDFDEVSNALKKTYDLYDLDLFVFDSLNQYDLDLKSYEDVLNIVWSKQLRNGFWRKFMDALYVQSMDMKYQVRLGTAGFLELEVGGDCNKSEPLIYRKGDVSVKAPKYIWAHLKKLRGSVLQSAEVKPTSEPEEFVVIGFNSPYLSLAELANENSICANICNEIPWLSGPLFRKMRLMPVNGIMICCRVEDVIDKLDNFPYTHGKTFNFSRRSTLNTEVSSTRPIPELIPDSVAMRESTEE